MSLGAFSPDIVSRRLCNRVSMGDSNVYFFAPCTWYGTVQRSTVHITSTDQHHGLMFILIATQLVLARRCAGNPITTTCLGPTSIDREGRLSEADPSSWGGWGRRRRMMRNRTYTSSVSARGMNIDRLGWTRAELGQSQHGQTRQYPPEGRRPEKKAETFEALPKCQRRGGHSDTH